jgi:ASC-1-like (ASCH) protein
VLLEQFVSTGLLPEITSNSTTEHEKLSEAPKLKKGVSWLQNSESFNQNAMEEVDVEPVKVTIKVSEPSKNSNHDRPSNPSSKVSKQSGIIENTVGDSAKQGNKIKNSMSHDPVIPSRSGTDTALKSIEVKYENKREKQAAANDAAYKSIEEKKEREKAQIKEQYEKFRKMKNESDAIAASSNVKNLENNLDDIRSLLESLQEGTPIQTNGSTVKKA